MEQGREQATSLLPTLLTSAELHRQLRPGLSPGSWRNWAHRACRQWGFPMPVRVGARGVAWRSDEVAAWVASRERGGRFDGRPKAA